MIYLALISILSLSVTAAVLEAKLDRKGEDEDGKIEDGVALFLFTVALCWAAWVLFDIMPWKVAPILLAVRILIFDYLVHYRLKKHSENHHGINIWKYTGETAKWDRLISRIPPLIRLVLRLSLFGLAVVYFLWEVIR